MFDKVDKWVSERPATRLLLTKLSDFLWFFAKFSVCMLIYRILIEMRG